MAKLSSKHASVKGLFFNDFTGGLNLSVPPSTIAFNECYVATNFEFGTEGLFRVRDGVSPLKVVSSGIRGAFPVPGTSLCLINSANTVYTLNVVSGALATLGTVDIDSSRSVCVFTLWNDKTQVVMAFGKSLYVYDVATNKLTKVTSSGCPTAVEKVFNRSGRIVVAQSGSDTLRYSGIGDVNQWTDNTNDASTSKSLNVGYKDGCSIVAIEELAGDLFVFKAPSTSYERGKIYRVANDYPAWSVRLYTKGTTAVSNEAVAVQRDNLYFLSPDGLEVLSATDTYSEFSTRRPGYKIDDTLVISKSCKLRMLHSRNQLWYISDIASVMLYHYDVGDNGAWTMLRFAIPVIDVFEHDGYVFIVSSTAIYKYASNYLSDNVYSGSELINVAITAEWSPRIFENKTRTLIKLIHAIYYASPATVATLYVEGLKVPLPPSIVGSTVAALDDTIAALNNAPLSTDITSRVRKRCQISRWNITPTIEVVGGGFHLESLSFDTVEV